jgi:hypothetical protein
MTRSIVYSSSRAAESVFVASSALSTRDRRIGIAAINYTLANVISIKAQKI